PFLAEAIRRFDPEALRGWAEGLGEATFIGTSGRVFPEAFRTTSLLRAWLRRLDDLGVARRTRHTWTGWTETGDLSFIDAAGEVVAVSADATVLALGGASWPRTGSDGAWVGPLTADGVSVTPLRPANCGFVVGWSDVFAERFAGSPIKDVAITHGDARARGDAMVTADGLEGGPVYALARGLRQAIDDGDQPVVHLRLFPDANLGDIEARLARRRPKDSVATGLDRAGLSPVAVGLLREVTGNRMPADHDRLAALLRAVPVRLRAPRPIARAISTAGGVALDAVDEHQMLRARPGTFVAGEMLDWEAPTGGYLLQATFSTGVAAAEGVRAWLAWP
ncbi:MAG: TIGR03862 family flavoprotein, partial [Acidimicrobiales bacterium]|nr:TIGR03862 family flavoprotein [Acidimicrobiales bacterium]